MSNNCCEEKKRYSLNKILYLFQKFVLYKKIDQSRFEKLAEIMIYVLFGYFSYIKAFFIK